MRYLFPFLLLSSIVYADPWQVVVNADLSSTSKGSGYAILAGAEIAVAEINAQGGILGEPIELVVKDHRANPARGILHVEQAAKIPNLLAILGGAHTPVILAELEAIHQENVLYLVPWAAGTAIVDNGYEPNNVFRVSLRDEWVGRFLVEQAQSLSCERLIPFLERTGWGRSNDTALSNAAQQLNYNLLPPIWFNWQSRMLNDQVSELPNDVQGDCLAFVGNAPDGVTLLKALEAANSSLTVLSHWGIAANDIVVPLGMELLDKRRLYWANTHAANEEKTQVGTALKQTFVANYGQPNNSYHGVVHAYDLIHLLALAVEQAQSGDIEAVRKGLYSINEYYGAMKVYQQPFSKQNHEGLQASDLMLLKLNENGLGEAL